MRHLIANVCKNINYFGTIFFLTNIFTRLTKTIARLNILFVYWFEVEFQRPWPIFCASWANLFVIRIVVSTKRSAQLVKQLSSRLENELLMEPTQVSQQVSFSLCTCDMNCSFCCSIATTCWRSPPPPPAELIPELAPISGELSNSLLL